jgi:hypothetical protein
MFINLLTKTNRFNFDSILKWMRAIYIALIHFKTESKLNRFVGLLLVASPTNFRINTLDIFRVIVLTIKHTHTLTQTYTDKP